ncbi:39S ribosomal protein L37, mitochondrial [Engraulis encrasicolus]|uniref:39S ribosomal protein L37, mitochondrial n=1 Tax=Engraulis encrasicolus TaxID=184585 RepID=UPI002FD139AF
MLKTSFHRGIAIPGLEHSVRSLFEIELPSSRHGHRLLSSSSSVCGKAVPRKKPKENIEINGLEKITYAERMHYVPVLAKPIFPPWKPNHKDPLHHRSSSHEEMPLYKDKSCHVFHQRTKLTEGVKQSLWLTKSRLVKGIPAQIMALADDPSNQIENQDERVQNAIKHARFWDTTERRPERERFCPTLLNSLIYMCRLQQGKHPGLGQRLLSQDYSLSASWHRGENHIQVRGKNGMLLSSMSPLPAIAERDEVQATADTELETFYPISPTIDLQCINVYDVKTATGFSEGYRYPHGHTLFFAHLLDGHHEELRAKMVMFAFGNALARARALYGAEPQVLEKPVVLQSVGTNGRLFQFMVFQLNTTDLASDDGVKNLVWIDEDQPLYEFAKVRPLIKKKVVEVPAGLAGYNPDTFKKFLAFYLHGAV